MWSYESNGYRDGARLREEILKFQRLEPEFKADLEGRIRSLEHDVEHYQKYYDWYFKLYHAVGKEGCGVALTSHNAYCRRASTIAGR